MLVLGSWLHYCLFILLTVTAVASLNHTIDDASSSVTYVPSGSWSQGNGCSGCWIVPDASQAFDNTWHDTTYIPGDPQPYVTVQFDGVAVYVYNILANTVPTGAATTTSLVFTLDGEDGPPFLHTPTDSTDFQYNQLVFAAEGLEMTTHTLTMQAADDPKSVILFDYIVYVTEDPPSDPPPLDPPPPAAPPLTSIPSSSSSPSSDITPSTPSSVTTGISTNPTPSTLVTTTTTSTALVDSTSLSISPIAVTLNSSSKPSSLTQSPSSPNATIPVFSSRSAQSTGTRTLSPQPSSSSSSSVSIGVVAGGAAAGVIALFLLAILTFILCRRHVRLSPYGVLKKEKRDATGGGVAHAESVQEQQDVDPEPDSASGLIVIGAARTVSRTSSPRCSQRTFATLSYTDGYVTHRASLQDVPRSEVSLSSDLIESSEGSSTCPGSRWSAMDGNSEKALIRHSENGVCPLPPPMPASTTDSSEPRDVSSIRSEGNAMLHAQVAALREEIGRLRERQEMQEENMHFDEVLPGYDQV